MQVTIADATTQTALAAPSGVGSERDFACHITLTVVDVEFQRFSFVAFNQGE